MNRPIVLPDAVLQARQENKRYILAIDGRCGSGKTTLGQMLAERLDAALVHMDDFYLPPQQRAENWMEIPAGNMDLERVRDEVLAPFRQGSTIQYCPFVCRTGELGVNISLPEKTGLILEGSYSHHPILRPFYDWTIFVTCGREEQRCRLREREGERFASFARVWIPKEEQYFSAFSIEQSSDQVIDTGGGTK